MELKVERDEKRKAERRRVGRVAERQGQTKLAFCGLESRSGTTLARTGIGVGSGCCGECWAVDGKRRRARLRCGVRVFAPAAGRRDGAEGGGTCTVAATAACKWAAGPAGVLGMNMQKESRAQGPGGVRRRTAKRIKKRGGQRQPATAGGRAAAGSQRSLVIEEQRSDQRAEARLQGRQKWLMGSQWSKRPDRAADL